MSETCNVCGAEIPGYDQNKNRAMIGDAGVGKIIKVCGDGKCNGGAKDKVKSKISKTQTTENPNVGSLED